MALSTQSNVLAKQRAFHYNFKPATQGFLRWLFSWFSQFAGNPDLQVVEFAALTNGNTVLADAACKLYGVFLSKDTATASWFKGADSATTAATDGSAEISQKTSGAGGEFCLIYPEGLALANGLTVCGNTTATGSTGSGANGPRGFVLIGAA